MSAPWLSREEVIQLTGWSKRHLQRLASAGAVESRESKRRGRNGQPSIEYALASLPNAARAKYLEGRDVARGEAETHPAGSPLSLVPVTADAANTAALALQTPIRVALKPKDEIEAARRMSVIRPLLDYLKGKRDGIEQLQLPGGEPITNSDSLVRCLAQKSGVSAGSIWRWKRRFEVGGGFALARKPRVDKHKSTWAAANRDLADLAVLIYLGSAEQPAQSVTVAWEQVCERARRMKAAEPSYSTVRAFLNNPEEVSPSMRVYGREGRRKYDARFAPFISRGYTDPAYSIIVSDHRIHDVLCQNDLFGERGLEHIRVQTTTLLDYRSRFVVGSSCSVYGSSHSIKRCLRQAFEHYGLFDQFYCDNGKDYRKVARGARPRELKEMDRNAGRECVAEAEEVRDSVMARLGIPVTFCIPFHPQSKHVERFHNTVRERFDKQFITYTGSAPHLRPDATTAALARHGKLLQMGHTGESQLPLVSEFIAMYHAWIEQWYHQQPQDGEGMGGRTPAQVFEAERASIQRPCPEPAVLSMLLCERTRRKVSNCEIEISMNGSSATFVPDLSDAYANLQMHERCGRSVVIAYDPLDPMYVAVLDDDLQFLCRLQRKDLMRFSSDEETRGRIAGFMENRNGLRKAVRESTAALSRRVHQGGYVTLVDQMRERMELPQAVGQCQTPFLDDVAVQRPERPSPDADIKETHSEDNAARYFEQLRHGGTSGSL